MTQPIEPRDAVSQQANRQKIITRLLVLALLLLPAQGLLAEPVQTAKAAPHKQSAKSQTPAYISIIIDDIGYKYEADRQAVALPGKLTYAFLPHTPYAVELAHKVHTSHRDVMLHMPMQSMQASKASMLGPGAITLDMDHQQFLDTLYQSLASIPYVQGVNNHMGSLITRHPGHMGWLMQELKKLNLYFVDSRTTKETVAEQIATENQVPNIRRHVFLDHLANEKAIEFQFNRLIRLARKDGYAVAIGHPYPATIKVLKQRLPLLQKQGVTLVPLSELLSLKKEASTWHMSSSHSPKVAKNSKQ